MENTEQFKAKYDAKNKQIIESLPKDATPQQTLDILQQELKKAIEEDQQELGRPMTYAEMRARYG
jgi:oligoendopeptidase F